MYQQNVTTKTMRNITRRPAPYEGKRYNNFTIFLYGDVVVIVAIDCF